MSVLVDNALAAAGLTDVLERRRRGLLPEEVPALAERLASVDLMVLGALADAIRTEEVGADVHIYVALGDGAVPSAPLDGERPVISVAMEGADGAHTGLDLLRNVALARILGPARARVRIPWQSTGLELAQVALGFGADELVGLLSTKRGLPLAPGELSGTGKKSARISMDRAKREELRGFVRRSGRFPVFVEADGRCFRDEPKDETGGESVQLADVEEGA